MHRLWRLRMLRPALAVIFLMAVTTAWLQSDSEVRIRFAGTGHPDIVSGKPRMQAGIVIDVAGERWLLDAGAGVVARLYDNKTPPESLTRVFLSHLHYDHCVDLDAVLLLWRTGGPAPQSGGAPAPPRYLTLYGPDGAEKMLTDLYDIAYGWDGRGRALLKMPTFRRVKNREAGTVERNGYKASFLEVKHAEADCWAIRLETPKGVVVYSGDIGSPKFLRAEDNAHFGQWARGADMLIIDTLHLPPVELGKIVAQAKPKTLVLSHLSERSLPVFRHYDLKQAVEICGKSAGKVVVAEEGMELKL